MAKRDPKNPRGILTRAQPGAVTGHVRIAPPADLAAWVEHFWRVTWDVRESGPQPAETLTHPSVHVVFERSSNVPRRSAIGGLNRGRFARQIEGVGAVFGIKFLPGMFRPFWNRPVSTLLDRMIPLTEVFSPASEVAALERRVHELLDEFPERDGMGDLGATAADFVRRRLPAEDPAARAALRAVDEILGDPSILTVEEVAKRCGSSPRALQRLFREYVGLSPKWVIRRYRLHEAVARIGHDGARSDLDWADLALELGYSDQAHFVRDFKQATGRPPGKFFRLFAR